MVAALADPGAIGGQLAQPSERIAMLFGRIRLLTIPPEPDHQARCKPIEATLEILT